MAEHFDTRGRLELYREFVRAADRVRIQERSYVEPTEGSNTDNRIFSFDKSFKPLAIYRQPLESVR